MAKVASLKRDAAKTASNRAHAAAKKKATKKKPSKNMSGSERAAASKRIETAKKTIAARVKKQLTRHQFVSLLRKEAKAAGLRVEDVIYEDDYLSLALVGPGYVVYGSPGALQKLQSGEGNQKAIDISYFPGIFGFSNILTSRSVGEGGYGRREFVGLEGPEVKKTVKDIVKASKTFLGGGPRTKAKKTLSDFAKKQESKGPWRAKTKNWSVSDMPNYHQVIALVRDASKKADLRGKVLSKSPSKVKIELGSGDYKSVLYIHRLGYVPLEMELTEYSGDLVSSPLRLPAFKPSEVRMKIKQAVDTAKRHTSKGSKKKKGWAQSIAEAGLHL